MAPEGKINITEVTPGQLKEELAGDNIPIMPEFAPEPPQEDPATVEAREKLAEVTKNLKDIDISSPVSSGNTGSGSALSKTIAFINRSTEDKTVSAIEETNSLLAQVIDETRRNRIQLLEGGI